MKMPRYIKSAIPAIIILIGWQIAYISGIWSAYVLPSPHKVWHSFLQMVRSGVLAKHITVSFERVLIGFIIAFLLAFMLGILASSRESMSVYYDSLIEFMRNVPPLSLIALLILWFGIGEASKIILIVLASFFPMFLNIKKGFTSCDKKLLEVGKSYGFTYTRSFFKIILPNATPDILVGMRIGLGYSWRAIIGSEMIAASSGLGYLILDAQQMSRSDKVIVGILVIGTVGIVCDKIFLFIIKKVVHGGVDNSWN